MRCGNHVRDAYQHKGKYLKQTNVTKFRKNSLQMVASINIHSHLDSIDKLNSVAKSHKTHETLHVVYTCNRSNGVPYRLNTKPLL